MTDERERMAKVILDHFHGPDERHSSWWINTGEMTDALRAAGFGDVAAERALFEDAARRETSAYRQIHALQARVDAALAVKAGRDAGDIVLKMRAALTVDQPEPTPEPLVANEN